MWHDLVLIPIRRAPAAVTGTPGLGPFAVIFGVGCLHWGGGLTLGLNSAGCGVGSASCRLAVMLSSSRSWLFLVVLVFLVLRLCKVVSWL